MQVQTKQLQEKLAQTIRLRDLALSQDNQWLVAHYEAVIIRLELLIDRHQMFLDQQKKSSDSS